MDMYASGSTSGMACLYAFDCNLAVSLRSVNTAILTQLMADHLDQVQVRLASMKAAHPGQMPVWSSLLIVLVTGIINPCPFPPVRAACGEGCWHKALGPHDLRQQSACCQALAFKAIRLPGSKGAPLQVWPLATKLPQRSVAGQCKC